jgi:S1-C subfamily serine protease
MPSAADGLVEDLTSAMDDGVFPRVFEGLGPEPIAPVDAPDGAVTKDPDVVRALKSVVHVRSESDGCGQAQVGSGWVVARGRVATNAHVVAGAERVTVSVRGTGREHSARVVAFDPRRDVAVLEVTDLDAPVAKQGAALDTGAEAAVAGFPGDEGLSVGAARVRDVLRARGADIYGTPDVTREIYSLRAQVRRGASGGPVLDRRGEVVGMVFATSLDDADTGYALTLDEVAPVLRRGVLASRPVSTGRCLSG